MNVETRQTSQGTEINIETDRKIAVAVKTSEGERIYLPEGRGSDSTYYVEEPESLVETENGYKVIHTGEVDEVEVIS